MRSPGPWVIIILFVGLIWWLSSQTTALTKTTAHPFPGALPVTHAQGEKRDAPRDANRDVSRAVSRETPLR